MAQDTFIQSGLGGKSALDVNQVGPIPLPVIIVEEDPSNPQVVTTTFSEITAVASSINTNLLTYTVPFGKTFYASRILVSGTNIAQYEVYVNAVIQARRRTWFGEGLNETFEFFTVPSTGVKLNAGDTINVKVEHFRPDLGDFEATLVGLLVG